LFGVLAQNVQAVAELRSASDVVVDREPSGTLVVSGRALKSRVRLSSTEELKALLKTLPAPGIAMVSVAYKSDAGGIQGLVAPRPAEVAHAERELLGILEDAGFRQARGSIKSVLPLSEPEADGRPTKR
jgi:hypothetical protein